MCVVLLICLSLPGGGGTSGQSVIQLPAGQPVIQQPIGQSGVVASVHGGNHIHPQGPAREGSKEPVQGDCPVCSYHQVPASSQEKTGNQMRDEMRVRTNRKNFGSNRIQQFGQATLAEAVDFPMDHRLREKRTTSACPPGCSSCSAVNGCVTCERRYFMFLYRRRMRQTGMCATSCPPGYYGVRYRQYSKCNKCQIAACETCVSRHYCTRCFKPHVAHGGGCVVSCPPGSVLDERREACVESVDCKVGTWGAWSTCRSRGRVCTRRGVKTRSRPVLQTPSPGNAVCPDLQERRRCKVPCKDGCRHRTRGKRKRKRGRTRKRKKHRRRGRSKKRKSPKRRCRNGLRQRCRRTRRC